MASKQAQPSGELLHLETRRERDEPHQPPPTCAARGTASTRSQSLPRRPREPGDNTPRRWAVPPQWSTRPTCSATERVGGLRNLGLDRACSDALSATGVKAAISRCLQPTAVEDHVIGVLQPRVLFTDPGDLGLARGRPAARGRSWRAGTRTVSRAQRCSPGVSKSSVRGQPVSRSQSSMSGPSRSWTMSSKAACTSSHRR